jgi:hypothetical protein
LLTPNLVKNEFNPQLNSSFSSLAHHPVNSKDSSFISPLAHPPANYKPGSVLPPNALPLRTGFTGISFTKEFEHLLQYIAVTAGNTKLPQGLKPMSFRPPNLPPKTQQEEAAH